MRTVAVLGLLAATLAGSVARAAEPAVPNLADYRFAPPPSTAAVDQVNLGRRLYFDRRLSGDGTMNCATCHLIDEGFDDGRTVSAAYPTNGHFRNTPTTVNAAYRERLTWDGRAANAEEQALGPIGSPFEMNLDLTLMEEKLRTVPEYRRDFALAFGREEITRTDIARALAAFETTLVAAPAPFDRYAAGEMDALDDAAKKGLALFFGRAKCVACHDGPHFGGRNFESLGLAPDPTLPNEPLRIASLRAFARFLGHPLPPGPEEDLGRAMATGEAADRGKFLVPTLRQLARTDPYGHDGRFATLRDVIDLIDAGGGPMDHRSPKLAPLGLSEEEKGQLEAFLLSLTGDDPVVRPPVPIY